MTVELCIFVIAAIFWIPVGIVSYVLVELTLCNGSFRDDPGMVSTCVFFWPLLLAFLAWEMLGRLTLRLGAWVIELAEKCKHRSEMLKRRARERSDLSALTSN